MKLYSASRLRRSPLLMRRAIALSCRGSRQAEADLLLLPDFREARSLLAAGKTASSLPLLERTREVVRATLRGSPVHEAVVAHRQLQARLRLGEYRRAETVWEDVRPEGFLGLQRLRAISLCRLLSGDVQGALSSAEEAVQTSEAQSFEDADLEQVFSPSYGILGICQFYAGETEEAETQLQKAARWAADDAQLQAISACNLGEHPAACALTAQSSVP